MGFYEECTDEIGKMREVLDNLSKIINSQRVLVQEGRYAIIDRGYEYVVACGFNGDEWNQGYYYTHWCDEKAKVKMLSEAIEHFRCLTDEEHISRSRLEELATNFKDGLITDDEESAMEYFKGYCDMSEREMNYFGLKEEE